jgi:hypothetical protein
LFWVVGWVVAITVQTFIFIENENGIVQGFPGTTTFVWALFQGLRIKLYIGNGKLQLIAILFVIFTPERSQ